MKHCKNPAMRILCLVLTLAMVLCIMPEKITVSAEDTEPVGQLKILARYNDSMQFYDGHVYLLFTSYKDGVEITVDDLYAGYEIKDRYYEDIGRDISYGSNHNKETTADDYFTENRDMRSVTLDRGEIVTIGMYRDFDLSVPQAALGSIQNSTIAKMPSNISDAAKTAFMENLFSYLKYGTPAAENSLLRLFAELRMKGIDPNLFLDGTVSGGVCFNRELYNQKLEWDQYENVTYAEDITQAQLDRMVSTLSGNLNKFSMLKNSCATVAVKAWNAAVGTNADGSKNSRHLEPSGSGIFAYIDAPKTVKDEIMNKLPGYWLNNSQGVAEPGAGYQDETGWVYVSAPKKLDGAQIIINEPSVRIISHSSAKGQENEDPVGRLTIASRHIMRSQMIAHSLISFTPYDDLDLDVSWYDYYKPTEDYIALMEDYEKNPEKYPSDPAAYNEDISVGNRKDYFDIIHNGAGSAPETLSINAGESITVSNYSHEENNLILVLKTLENGRIASDENAAVLIEQMHIYDEGGKIDGPLAFDAFAATINKIYSETRATGSNPADGIANGGMDINREAYNRFSRKDHNCKYVYYTVELTPSELEALRAYLEDTDNNKYGFMTKNCTSAVVDIWNAALYDRPELALTGNLTGIAGEPESLCFELMMLRAKTGKVFSGTGEGGGDDYYPRIAPGYRILPEVTPPEARELVYTGKAQKLVIPGSAEGGTMWYALGTDAENAPGEDSAWSKSVPRATDADTYYVWYKVIGDGKYSDTEPACIEVTIRKTRRQLIAEAKANTVTITDISSKLIGTLTVGWESEYPADGYDVVLWNTRRMGGNMLVSRFDVDGSESGINVYGLIPNSRYYVRVRAYKVIDGERVYGRFSETESVSVKGFFFTRLFAPAYSYGRPYLSPSRYTAATDPYFFYRF